MIFWGFLLLNTVLRIALASNFSSSVCVLEVVAGRSGVFTLDHPVCCVGRGPGCSPSLVAFKHTICHEKRTGSSKTQDTSTLVQKVYFFKTQKFKQLNQYPETKKYIRNHWMFLVYVFLIQRLWGGRCCCFEAVLGIRCDFKTPPCPLEQQGLSSASQIDLSQYECNYCLSIIGFSWKWRRSLSRK